MRKILFSFLLSGLIVLPLLAEVGVISVTDTDKHSKKEDFSHTFEYLITPIGQMSGKVGKCQATRIAKRWFATAAHCVIDSCKKGCEIRMDLVEANTSAWVSTTHTPKKPTVFWHPDFTFNTFVKNDFALIYLDLDNAPVTYYRRATASNPVNTIIRKEEFSAFLSKNRAARLALYRVYHPSFPPLMIFDEGNYKLDRILSVIAIFDGKRDVKINKNPVYYVKKLGFAYTKNFGVRQGMSGSGVMTNTGELIGVISGTFQSFYQTPNSKIKEENLFMFSVFNKSIASFMENVMGRDYSLLDWKDAYPYSVVRTKKDFSSVVQMVQEADQRKSKNPNPSN